jgi:hypothetical protein
MKAFCLHTRAGGQPQPYIIILCRDCFGTAMTLQLSPTPGQVCRVGKASKGYLCLYTPPAHFVGDNTQQRRAPPKKLSFLFKIFYLLTVN